jgi:cytochrome c oxidase assembly factor CtaG
MNPIFESSVRSWPFEPWILLSLVAGGAIYLRGWIVLRRHDPGRWSGVRLTAFLGGLAGIYLALASPIEPFAALFLLVHMVQHVLLMMVVPPLLWLGDPFFPMLRGLPRPIRIIWVAPLFRLRTFRRFFAWLSHPKIALPLFVAASLGWHVPAAYELALRSPGWHTLEHVCFIGAGLLFWYPVIRPYPSRPAWSLWLLFPYLILADVQNTVLAALLTFSDRLLYPYYAEVPRIGGLSAVEDQSVAGVIMWVPGSVAYLVPLFVIGVWLLLPARARVSGGAPSSRPSRERLQLPILQLPIRQPPTASHGFDLLATPLLGRFLKWRHARLALQLPLAMVAAALIVDGLRGPQIAAVNLAGVLPWIHWRGVLILVLLVAGNFFCMACPFTLPRRLAGRWLGQGRAWPRWLRSKWLAIGLLALFLWAYESFSLWNSPLWTAWIAIGYFVGAFAVDGLFRAGTFCKYVCPIGQFNFVQSLVSPLEVKVLSPAVCSSCRTHECIRGSDAVPGCQTRLFQPHKASNMDCTFCLDCVHACPHENVGLIADLPGKELWRDSFRSGVGRFARRPDLAALIVLLVFGGLANAAGMVGPVVEWQDKLRLRMGGLPIWTVTTLFAAISLIVAPAIVIGLVACVSRWCGQIAGGWIDVATRFSYALVPLGFGMWLSHYSFHFLTSWETALPATQRAFQDLGWTFLGQPRYQCACCRPVGDWLLRLQILFLDAGLLLSLYTGYRIALTEASKTSRALSSLAPWALLICLLFAAAIWIVFQPMQMRGTLPGAA